jgi:hypothetical protein
LCHRSTQSRLVTKETYAWAHLSIVTLLEDAVAQSEAVPLEVSASTDTIRPDRMPTRSVARAGVAR